MKKIFTAFLIVFSFSFCKAQWVTIPDPNFVSWLQTNYPACMSGNLMDTTCSWIISDTMVNCQVQNITNLDGIQYFDSLKQLGCPVNQITSLPTLPKSLTKLICNNNQLTGFISLPDSLIHLNCANNLLINLPPLPINLTYLNCFGNQLSALPVLPPKLITLECISNQLTYLPLLPDSLKYLMCSQNQITNLPALPPLLESIYCYQNLLTTLPPLPGSLTELYCYSNLITSLPALPNSLQDLWCSFNHLTDLPLLPDSIIALNCRGNQLTSIPNLPSTMVGFDIGDNLGIMCMPYLNQFTGYFPDFNISGTGITCLPNIIQHAYSIPAIDTMPVCDVFNSNGCPVFWNIFGKIYFDDNINCIYDSIDISQTNVPVQIWQGGNLLQQTFTVGGGIYSFDVNTYGTYEVKIDTTNLPFYVLCPNSGVHTSIISAVDSMDSDADFSLVCKPDYDVAANSVARDSGWLFPGINSLISIHAGDLVNFYGASCMSGVGGQLTITLTGPVQYIGYAAGSLAPTTVAGNTLTWSIVDFGTVDFFNDFHIRLLTDTTATIGDFVCIDATITSNPADVNQSNNHLNQCFAVVNSFDPNVKEVSPQELTSANEYLTYTIHFQNTGTAPAQHIQILDTLDSDLDLTTFQLLAYSHTNMTQVLEGGIVHFNFPNINLPDSMSNEPASHGYIQYKIKPKAGTPLTSSFDNTANIYFDFNSPVVTNTTHTSFATGIQEMPIENELLIYPNPVTDKLTLEMLRQAQHNIVEIEIVDVLGRRIFEETVNQKSIIINLKSFASGIYFIKVKSLHGDVQVKKFVKQ